MDRSRRRCMDSKLKYPGLLSDPVPQDDEPMGAEATDVLRDRYDEAVDGAPPLQTEDDDGLGTSSSIEFGAEFVCFRTKHILRRSAALGRRVSGGVVSPGEDLVKAGDAWPDLGEALGSGLTGCCCCCARCGLQEAARAAALPAATEALPLAVPPSSSAGGSWEPGEADALACPASRDEAPFLRAALRSSDRARCSAGVDRRGGGVGGEPAALVLKMSPTLLPEMAALAAAAGDDGRMSEDRPGEHRPPSMCVEERELTSEEPRRSHCTAASRCHGNLGSPCWQLMSSALQ